MLDYLVNLVGRLGQWGYLIIFLVAMLESAAFLGLIIPGESLVLVTGFLAAQGLLDLDVLIVTVGIGAALGDSIGYEMGRWMGRPALLHYGSHFGLTNARVDKADAFFARHGSKAIFLGRFVGFARAIVPFLAGSSKMSYRKFLPYNVLGAALWSSAVVLLGYFLGASWQAAECWIGRASAILGGILLFFLLLVWLYRWAIRHESDIKQRWKHFLQRPHIAALRLQFCSTNRISSCKAVTAQLSWVKSDIGSASFDWCQLVVRWHCRRCSDGRPAHGHRCARRRMVPRPCDPCLNPMHAGHHESSRTYCHQHIYGVGCPVFGLEARLVLANLFDGDGPIRDAAECVDEICISPCPSKLRQSASYTVEL